MIGALLTVGFWLGAALGQTPAGDEEVLRRVLKVLAEAQEPQRRQAAVLALEAFGPQAPGVLLALTEALRKDPSPLVRSAAAQVLGQMGEDARRAIPSLTEALRQDAAPAVRAAAAKALGGKLVPYSKTAVLALGEALSDPDDDTRTAAAEALRNLGSEARAALRPLLETLKNPKAGRFTHIYALQAVCRFPDAAEEILPVVRHVLEQSADGSVRQAAVEGLGRFGAAARPLVPIVVRYFQDKKSPPSLRMTCAEALLAIGLEAAVGWPAVQAALSDADAGVRTQAIRLAGALGSVEPRVVPALLERALQDVHVEARLAAIQELGRLGSRAREAEPALRRLAQQDSRAVIRQAAQAAVEKIAGP
jgi:HEAT repeat protein